MLILPQVKVSFVTDFLLPFTNKVTVLDLTLMLMTLKTYDGLDLQNKLFHLNGFSRKFMEKVCTLQLSI